MNDYPSNSFLQYDFLLTLSNKEFWPGEQTTWDDNNYESYIRLRPGTNIAGFEKRITTDVLDNYYLPLMLKEGVKDARQLIKKGSLRLQSISDIHLRSTDISDYFTNHGDIRFIWLFGAIAGFILIIACINFINLSTAKSANRAKEVGLRKVVGSMRSSLINQFLTESLVYSFLSFILGLVLAWVLLPYFNVLASRSLSIPWTAWWLFPVIIGAAFVVGIIAGIYPAFYLSAFKPAQVLKGSISNGSKSSILRNSLVVFQFTASIILIIGTIVIYSQMKYILNKDVGFDKDQVVMIQGTNTLGDGIKTFKNELTKLATVKSVSISDYLPVNGTKRNGNEFFNEGRSHEDAAVGGQMWQIDNDYLQTLGIKLVAGRNFTPGMSTDSDAIIINETMAKKLNLKNPIGKRVTNGGGTRPVIGVVKDFNFDSMRGDVEPLALHWGTSPSIVSVKVSGADMKNTLSNITAVWKKFAPGQPIRYTFLDAQFASMYADVEQTGYIFTSFAILAIIIACLGLFALSAFMAEQRSKEIGIRKVLGATITNVTALLSIDFIKLVVLSIIIASPIAWWAMNKWLEDFSYRTPITWWMFGAAAIASICIALLTVSYQSIKAAVTNPVVSLRSE